MIFACEGLGASPTIDSIQTLSLENGAVITLTGGGFGSNVEQPGPILFDFTSEAYENGVLNTHQASFKDGQAIVRSDAGDPDTLWEKPSSGSNDASPPFVVSSLPARTPLSSAHYLMPGSNSFLGWPTAYGGSDTPTDNQKLYVAWYLKMKYDPRYYWGVSSESSTGNFIPGESVTINGIRGTFVGIGTYGIGKGLLEFELLDQRNANDLAGYQIKGLDSGAAASFPLVFAAGTGFGYEPPGANKYIRVWEDPAGKEGVRLSWTQMQVHTSWHWAPVTPRKWHFMELFLDTQSQEMKAYVDRQLIANLSTESEPAIKGKWSPTIALLGFNGKLQEFQKTEIDDIYMDKKFSRVVLGDKPKFADFKSYELQLPQKWSDNYINFKLNYGSLNPKGTVYVYVINEDGSVNSEGFPLCSDCNAPPSSVPLNIQ